MKVAQVVAGILALLFVVLLCQATTDHFWNPSLGVYERRPPVRVAMPDIRDWRSLRIRLQRTYCEGLCPDYSVVIAGDGAVTYHGNGFVAVVGTRQATIPVERVRELFARFEEAEFFWLFGRYSGGVVDAPTATVSISYDDHSKIVTDDYGERDGMPLSVVELAGAIDKAAGVDRWISGSGSSPSSDR